MKIGDHVTHKLYPKYGVGIIEGQWASWCACRECGNDTSPPTMSECPSCDIIIAKALSRRGHDRNTTDFRQDVYVCPRCKTKVCRPTLSYCKACKTPKSVLQVSAKNVFDVKFLTITKAVASDWLVNGKNKDEPAPKLKCGHYKKRKPHRNYEAEYQASLTA